MLALFLRIEISLNPYLHEWDEQYHALVAKNMIQYPLHPVLIDPPLLEYNYKVWLDNHIWLEKPPMPLWLMALGIKLFGNFPISVRIFSIIFSTLAVYLTFSIGKKLFNEKIGIIACFLHAIHGLILELCGGRISSDHVEILFIFFFELTVLLSIITYQNKNWKLYAILTGLSMGICFLCKWFPAYFSIILIIYIIFFFDKNKTFKTKALILLLIVTFQFLVVLPWLIHIYSYYPEETKWIISKYLFAYTDTLEEHQAPFYFYFHHILILFGELSFIPILLSFYFVFKNKKINHKLLFLFIWWFLPMLIFSFAATKRSTYMMMFAPALFIYIAYYYQYFMIVRNHKKIKWLAKMMIIFFPLLALRYSFERLKPFEKNEEILIEERKIINLDKIIEMKPQTVIFNYPSPIKAMFYHDILAYKKLPTMQGLIHLYKEKWNIYIYTNNDLPEAYKNINFVHYLK